MASLRLTTKIKAQIKGKGSNLFSERITKKTNSLRPDFYDDVVEQYIKEHIEPYTKNRLFPESWLHRYKQVTVRFSVEAAYFKSLNKSYTLIKLEDHTSTSDALIIETEYINSVLKDEYIEYYNSIQKLKKEQEAFTKELERVLNNCNTLTQFLKIWPQGEHLIEGLDLTVASTRTRKKREVNIDKSTLDTLNVGLLKQTMLNK